MKIEHLDVYEWFQLPEWYARGLIPYDPEFRTHSDGTVFVGHNGSKFTYPAKKVDGVWYYQRNNPHI